MTKYAKCSVCGYIVAIYDDTDASDYVCPVDGTTLVVATRTEYMVIEKAAATFVIAASDSLHKERADYVCNGVDDQVEIQAAIDALPTAGGVVYLLEGTYTASTSIAIVGKNNVTLTGSGMGSTKITCGANAHTLDIDNSDDVIIRDIRIDQTSTGNTVNAIRLDDAQRCKIQNVYIGDSDQHGIEFAGTLSADCEISSCYITGTDNDGITDNWQVCDNLVINKTIIKSCGADGIYIASPNCVIDNNVIESSAGGGIEISETSYAIVNNNLCTKNGENGIELTLDVFHSIIANNKCINNGWGNINTFDGIAITLCDYNVISDNVCYDNHSGCTAAGCQRHGILIYGSIYNTINGNICRDDLTDGIKIHGLSGNLADYNTLTGNVCEGNGGKGIYIFGDKANAHDYANKNIVVANQVFSNTGVNLDDDGTLTELGHNITA